MTIDGMPRREVSEMIGRVAGNKLLPRRASGRTSSSALESMTEVGGGGELVQCGAGVGLPRHPGQSQLSRKRLKPRTFGAIVGGLVLSRWVSMHRHGQRRKLDRESAEQRTHASKGVDDYQRAHLVRSYGYAPTGDNVPTLRTPPRYYS